MVRNSSPGPRNRMRASTSGRIAAAIVVALGIEGIGPGHARADTPLAGGEAAEARTASGPDRNAIAIRDEAEAIWRLLSSQVLLNNEFDRARADVLVTARKLEREPRGLAADHRARRALAALAGAERHFETLDSLEIRLAALLSRDGAAQTEGRPPDPAVSRVERCEQVLRSAEAGDRPIIEPGSAQ